MSTKEYTIGFYAATVESGPKTADDPSASKIKVCDVLSGIRKGKKIFSWKSKGYAYFVKDLDEWNSGRNFKGVFGKVRMADLPHICDAEGSETEIALADNEGLIEKNHFIYTEARKILMFQHNTHAAYVGTFGEYLTKVCSTTISFSPIIKSDMLQRFLKGTITLRKFDVSVARPTHAALFPSDDFSTGMLALLNSSKAATLSVHMSANGPGSRGAVFSNRVKQWIGGLVKRDLAKNAKVEVEENGQIFPIDLLADRIVSVQDVEMRGRYPLTKSMFEAMESARREAQEELDSYFGVGNQSID